MLRGREAHGTSAGCHFSRTPASRSAMTGWARARSSSWSMAGPATGRSGIARSRRSATASRSSPSTCVATDFFKAGATSPLHAWAVGQMQKTPPHVAAACLEGVLDADLRPHLRTLDVPTAVLHGRHDGLLPLAGGEVLAKGIRGARLTVFEDSAHAPFLEEPDTFNAALSELLAR